MKKQFLVIGFFAGTMILFSNLSQAVVNENGAVVDVAGEIVLDSLPLFFKNQLTKQQLLEQISLLWSSPEVELRSSDQARINHTKQAVLETTWQDYLETRAELFKGRLSSSSSPADSSFIEGPKIDRGGLIYVRPYNRFKRIFGTLLLSEDHQKDARKYAADVDKIDEWYLGHKQDPNHVTIGEPPMVLYAANRMIKEALRFMDNGADINKYAPKYGNNPLLISVAKGWNHPAITKWSLSEPTTLPQRILIEKLLERDDLNLNAVDLRTGMTALHLACLRGDDPDFIKRLLLKGADPKVRDYKGRTPLDLAKARVPYRELQSQIEELTHPGSSFRLFPNEDANTCFTASLPTRREREANLKAIRLLLEQAVVEVLIVPPPD